MLLELHLENYSNIVRGNYSSHTQERPKKYTSRKMDAILLCPNTNNVLQIPRTLKFSQ